MTLPSLISRLIGKEQTNIPNSFTVEMGNNIREARLEAGLSQKGLADKAYFHQASISLIESGKREVTTSELIYISLALSKPPISFYPKAIRDYFQKTPAELEELVLAAQFLGREDLRRLVIQVKALVEKK